MEEELKQFQFQVDVLIAVASSTTRKEFNCLIYDDLNLLMKNWLKSTFEMFMLIL